MPPSANPFFRAQLCCLERIMVYQFPQGIPSSKSHWSGKWGHPLSRHATALTRVAGHGHGNRFFSCCLMICTRRIGNHDRLETTSMDFTSCITSTHSFIFHTLSCIVPPGTNTFSAGGSPKLALNGVTLTHPFSMAQLSEPSGREEC